MARPPLAAALAAVLLVPALATGCTFLIPPPELDQRLGRAAYVVPDLNLSVDSEHGHVRVRGKVLAVPVQLDGAEAAAVYLGPLINWRADALFRIKEKRDVAGDLYVQAPAGSWAPERSRQGWVQAGDADLAAFGLPNLDAALKRAGALLPANASAPKPGLWLMNGTIAAQFDPVSTVLASEDGPFLFQRNATSLVVSEGRMLLSWAVPNRTLSASQDAIVGVDILDPRLATLHINWAVPTVSVRIETPQFTQADLQVTNEKTQSIISVEYPKVVRLTMASYVTQVVEDNLVEFKSKNMTVCAGSRCAR